MDELEDIARNVFIKVGHLPGDPFPCEQVASTRDGLALKCKLQLRVLKQASQSLRESSGVLGRYQKPCFSVPHRVLDAADGCADHRRPASHRLDRRNAKRLI